MNNESKCCYQCYGAPIDQTRVGLSDCLDPSCKCHTPAPEDWEKEFDELWGGWNGAPEGTTKGLDWHIKSFISRLLASREAAAFKKGKEASHDTEDGYCCACDYDIAVMEGKIAAARREGEERIKADLDEIWRKYRIAPFDSSMTVIEKLKDALGEQIDYFAALHPVKEV